MKDIGKGIGKRIYKLRDDKAMTQTAFAGPILITQEYVGMLERGNRKPSQRLVVSIAREYGVSADWLRTGRKEVSVT